MAERFYPSVRNILAIALACKRIATRYLKWISLFMYYLPNGNSHGKKTKNFYEYFGILFTSLTIFGSSAKSVFRGCSW
jgi:hypothetical protein